MKSVNQSIKPTTAKINDKGHIELGGCDCVELAREYGTPLYVIDEQTLRTVAREYKEAFKDYPNVRMMYASKALMNKAIAKIFSQEGFGFDVVSGGELYTVSKAGVDLSNVTFNGNNKSVSELEMALDLSVGRVSVDNFYELELLNSLAQKKNKIQKIYLRITPGIECHTHEYIQTGQIDSKFGFDLSQLDAAFEKIQNEYKNLCPVGLHAHIGSQIFETKVYEDEVKILIKEFERIKEKFGIELDEMNLGGGVGIKYTREDTPPSVYDVAKIIINAVKNNTDKFPKLFIEPGRSVVSTAGATLYTVGSSKRVPQGTKYVAVDGGMSDNPRPITYQAKYCADVVNKPEAKELEKVTIAGRFCESGDILIKDIELPKLESGDVLCVWGTGAYNYSMASNYNRVLKPAMILVNNSQSVIIVERETYEYMCANDKMPAHLK